MEPAKILVIGGLIVRGTAWLDVGARTQTMAEIFGEPIFELQRIVRFITPAPQFGATLHVNEIRLQRSSGAARRQLAHDDRVDSQLVCDARQVERLPLQGKRRGPGDDADVRKL